MRQARKDRLFAFGMEALSAAAVALRASEGKGKVGASTASYPPNAGRACCTSFHKQNMHGLQSEHADSEPLLLPASLQLYVQSFSNGGAMVWECVEEALQFPDGETVFQHKLTQEDKDVLALIRGSLAGKIFDSAPCYLWLNVGFRAIGTAVPGLIPRYLLQVRLERGAGRQDGHCVVWMYSPCFAG